MTVTTKCGFVAIVGRPNVGKSTLLNQILGQKLSITSPKPQTTRHQILGVSTKGDNQIIYLDTPGLHQKQTKAINRYMNKAVHAAIRSVDVVVFIVDIQYWTEEDEQVLKVLQNTQKPVILVLNKIDKLTDKAELLPVIEQMQQKMNFAAIVPLAALQGENVAALEDVIQKFLPESVHFYPEGQVTNRSTSFLLAELVREKIMRLLEEEVPYSATVMIEKMEDTEKVGRIHALIVVEREGQKGILIGKQGAMLKNIGRQARLDMETLLGKKVFLQLWVKVKEGWSDKDALLQGYGYDKPE